MCTNSKAREKLKSEREINEWVKRRRQREGEREREREINEWVKRGGRERERERER